jgi:ClpP class serine protease
MSGGTLIALAADEILMDPHAVLGSIDPQLSDPQAGVMPAASILRAVKEKGREKVDDLTLIKADIAEKAIKQLKELVVELTKDKLGLEKAEKLAEVLTTGQWTHDYPLTAKRLMELGIPVKTEIPEEVYMLMELYPQPAQRRPDVEFIPHPPIPSRPERPSQRQTG